MANGFWLGVPLMPNASLPTSTASVVKRKSAGFFLFFRLEHQVWESAHQTSKLLYYKFYNQVSRHVSTNEK